jgi:hypothetical protein
MNGVPELPAYRILYFLSRPICPSFNWKQLSTKLKIRMGKVIHHGNEKIRLFHRFPSLSYCIANQNPVPYVFLIHSNTYDETYKLQIGWSI